MTDQLSLLNKLEFEFSGPYPIGDGKVQYLATNNTLKIVADGETKEEAFNEAVVSLAFLLAYHQGYKLKGTINKQP